jgi:hypothetical protein
MSLFSVIYVISSSNKIKLKKIIHQTAGHSVDANDQGKEDNISFVSAAGQKRFKLVTI